MFSAATIFPLNRSAALPFAVLAALSAAGCANPGPPRPPSLHLPAIAAGLKVDRVGGETLLTWTTPDKTSDGLPNRQSISAAICREEPARGKPGASPPVCDAVSHLFVKPGESHATDTLPLAMTQDPPRLLVYRIDLLNSHGRSAGLSAPAFAAAGAAPADPGPVHVSARRKGAVIEWTPQTSGSAVTMEVSRTLITDAQGPVLSRPASASQGKRSPVGLPSSSKKDPAAPVLLEAAQSSGTDPGGLLDTEAKPNDSYVYTAQHVRTVSLGGHTLELRSAASPPVTFEYRDVIPPRAPTGLESVATASLAGAASIDLSWEYQGEGESESGLQGFNVYRSDGASAKFMRLNQVPIPGPAFRDLTAQPGYSYRYRVTAVDRSNNESGPSKEIEDRIRRQP